jgi:hypothetical protein
MPAEESVAKRYQHEGADWEGKGLEELRGQVEQREDLAEQLELRGVENLWIGNGQLEMQRPHLVILGRTRQLWKGRETGIMVAQLFPS